MSAIETIVVSRADLLQLKDSCYSFLARLGADNITVQGKDIPSLKEWHRELNDLFAKATEMRILRMDALPPGLWSEKGVINDKGWFQATKPRRIEQIGARFAWRSGEHFKISPECLPAFFRSAAGFLKKHTYDVEMRGLGYSSSSSVRRNSSDVTRPVTTYRLI